MNVEELGTGLQCPRVRWSAFRGKGPPRAPRIKRDEIRDYLGRIAHDVMVDIRLIDE